MKIFLHGIGGVGMSSLAGLFHCTGHQVSGSDQQLYPPSDRILADLGVRVFSPYRVENIPPDLDLSVIGNIISRGNPELEHLLNQGIEYSSMAHALYRFFIRDKIPIVVAGTHGKTTTASFLAFLLKQAGMDPGYFIGGQPFNLPCGYAAGRGGGYFIVEGDEYETAFFDRSSKFLKYHPRILILTSLEYDHIDFFPTPESYRNSFANLVDQVPSQGMIVGNVDYPMNREVIKGAHTPVIGYGTKDGDARVGPMQGNSPNHHFTLRVKGKCWSFATPVSGDYNAGNLAAGILLGVHLGIDLGVIRQTVSLFQGVKRRLHLIRKLGNTLFFEDFAHHPTAIGSVIAALKKSHSDCPLTLVIEPASASLRRNYFLDPLINALAGADQVILKKPPGMEKIPGPERLDTGQIIRSLTRAGQKADLLDSYAEIKAFLQGLDTAEPRLVLMVSNGRFGDLPAFVKGKLD